MFHQIFVLHLSPMELEILLKRSPHSVVSHFSTIQISAPIFPAKINTLRTGDADLRF